MGILGQEDLEAIASDLGLEESALGAGVDEDEEGFPGLARGYWGRRESSGTPQPPPQTDALREALQAVQADLRVFDLYYFDAGDPLRVDSGGTTPPAADTQALSVTGLFGGDESSGLVGAVALPLFVLGPVRLGAHQSPTSGVQQYRGDPSAGWVPVLSGAPETVDSVRAACAVLGQASPAATYVEEHITRRSVRVVLTAADALQAVRLHHWSTRREVIRALEDVLVVAAEAEDGDDEPAPRSLRVSTAYRGGSGVVLSIDCMYASLGAPQRSRWAEGGRGHDADARELAEAAVAYVRSVEGFQQVQRLVSVAPPDTVGRVSVTTQWSSAALARHYRCGHCTAARLREVHLAAQTHGLQGRHDECIAAVLAGIGVASLHFTSTHFEVTVELDDGGDSAEVVCTGPVVVSDVWEQAGREGTPLAAYAECLRVMCTGLRPGETPAGRASLLVAATALGLYVDECCWCIAGSSEGG